MLRHVFPYRPHPRARAPPLTSSCVHARVQFPISMSLPAILIDHVLAAGNGPLMPALLVPFDAYSDAGHLALRVHGVQHLYEEIEAEANLLFDQVRASQGGGSNLIGS